MILKIFLFLLVVTTLSSVLPVGEELSEKDQLKVIEKIVNNSEDGIYLFVQNRKEVYFILGNELNNRELLENKKPFEIFQVRDELRSQLSRKFRRVLLGADAKVDYESFFEVMQIVQEVEYSVTKEFDPFKAYILISPNFFKKLGINLRNREDR